MSRAELRDAYPTGGVADRESEAYLKEQLITYLGNKRALLSEIDAAVEKVKRRLGVERLRCFDVFSGSGVVARFLKQHSEHLIVNDLETYARITAACYLANREDCDLPAMTTAIAEINAKAVETPSPGFISELYAPACDDEILPDERVFYTRRNAVFIDTARQLIEDLPDSLKAHVLAPLLAMSSVHANTSGVFKGFYKSSRTGVGQFGGDGRDALTRIKRDIHIPVPVLSNFSCTVDIYQDDANEIIRQAPEADLAYIDPPYNQHPYGSNYFMLNLVADYRQPREISAVSGIPVNWNRSAYNKRSAAIDAFEDLVRQIKARFLLVSFNCEGFIRPQAMLDMLRALGRVEVIETPYNTFRGSRNLRGRSTHVTEYLYLVDRD